MRFVRIPLALLAGSLLFDLLFLRTGRPVFAHLALFSTGLSIAAALSAVVLSLNAWTWLSHEGDESAVWNLGLSWSIRFPYVGESSYLAIAASAAGWVTGFIVDRLGNRFADLEEGGSRLHRRAQEQSGLDPLSQELRWNTRKVGSRKGSGAQDL
jgi:hypothetical protein